MARCLTLTLAISLLGMAFPQATRGGDWPTVVIRSIPSTEAALAAAHEASEHACLEVPAGQPLEQPAFDRRIGFRLSGVTPAEPASRVVWYDTSRRSVITLGTNLAQPDEAHLPLLTGGAILDRVRGNYLAVQVRLQRDRESGEPFLHYRPLAAVGAYHKPAQTFAFASLTQAGVRDLRGMGMFVPDGQPLSAGALRTLVAVSKSTMATVDPDTAAERLTPNYELLLVRAWPVTVEAGDGTTSVDLQLHAFGTTGGRSRLHYFRPVEPPADADACTIRSTIFFTEYTLGGLYPTARACRDIRVVDRGAFSMAALDQHALKQGWGGRAFDHIDRVLDDIIAGRLKADLPNEAVDASIAEDGP